MTVKEILVWARNELNKAEIESAELDAEVLLCNVLNTVKTRQYLISTDADEPMDKSFPYAHPEYELVGKQLRKYKEYIERRARGEPVAYIVGEKEFYGLKFLVNKNVLVPRPETEHLTNEGLQLIHKNKSLGNKFMIVDVGTGSGCIAITLAKSEYDLKIYATDICKRALRVAEKNAKHYNVDKQITFLQGNLLEPILKKQENYKVGAGLAPALNVPGEWNNWILVTNLPYVPETEIGSDQPNTRGLKFEPKKALYAGKDGLNKYRELFEQFKKLKYKPKYIFCEIGDGQGEDFEKIVMDNLTKTKIEIKKDLAGLDRVVIVYV